MMTYTTLTIYVEVSQLCKPSVFVHVVDETMTLQALIKCAFAE